MEAASEAKPKRKYVMTHEHRAKVIASLEKEVGEFFQDAADRPPLSYPKDYQELRDRAEILPGILHLELGFLC